jgi:hypothetical protein
MNRAKKILILWVVAILTYVVGINLFPNIPSQLSARINQSIQLLLFFISIFVFLEEPIRKNKFIFLNFSAYFSMSFFSFCYDFVGKTFLLEKYARHLYSQYFTIAYILLLGLSVVYIVIDLLFKEFKVYQKYIITLAIVGGFFIAYFYPFCSNPLYLYSTEDIQQWRVMDAYASSHTEKLTPIELANNITLRSWSEGVAVGDLYPDKNLERIELLYPYLERDNWMVLLWKPFYKKIIFMNVMIVFFVLLYFGYQYKKDPPQGAYIDKIMFLILLFVSMDILHNWGYIKSVEWGSVTELFMVGQYITVIAELLMVLFFSLRLRFISSVQGEYYETELAANPQQISRWRDWIDNLVLSQFFQYKVFNGRLFQKMNGK